MYSQLERGVEHLPPEHLLELAAGVKKVDPKAIVYSHKESMDLRTELAWKALAINKGDLRLTNSLFDMHEHPSIHSFHAHICGLPTINHRGRLDYPSSH